LEFIRTHRALEVRLTARRIVATWLGTENPWRDFRSTDSWLIRAIFLFNGLVVFGTISGVAVLLGRRNRYAVPVAAIPILFPLVYYATHTSLRYRHPMDSVLLLLTAIVIVSLARPRTAAVEASTK